LDRDPQLFTSRDIYGVKIPQVIVMRNNQRILVDVECFDYTAWPERVGFYDLSLPENATMPVLVDGYPVSTLNVQWLLRQKIISYTERGSLMKRNYDAMDITRLVHILALKGEKLSITSTEENTALRKIVSDKPDLRDGLKRAVDCLGVCEKFSS
jgi:hypothetical protein